jgi:hypothetical protein
MEYLVSIHIPTTESTPELAALEVANALRTWPIEDVIAAMEIREWPIEHRQL